MYSYRDRKSLGPGPIFFIIFFLLVFIGAGVLFYMDKGRFWDFLPFICIPAAVINLILLIFYFAKRNSSAVIFTIFFIIFIAGIIISSFWGPFALYNRALEAYENERYDDSIDNFRAILDNYPNSRYAREASANIPYAYYLEGSYREAVIYFNNAFSGQLIDSGSLEIQKILSESYLKIGDEYNRTRDFANAAVNYMLAADSYEYILKNFPDTDEAFIAIYRAPEFLYKSALAFSRDRSWEDSSALLKRLIDNYPDSDFFEKSNELLFNIHIFKSHDFKDDGQYKESIIEFLKIFNFPDEILKDKEHQVDYQTRYILSGIDFHDILRIADETFRENEFIKAYFLYNYLLNSFPEDAELIIKNLIESKINIVSGQDYEYIGSSAPTGSLRKEGSALVLFENRTEYMLIIYLAGPFYNLIVIDIGQRFEIEIPSGAYRIVSELAGSDALPFFGEINYEEGNRYREIFEETGEKEQ